MLKNRVTSKKVKKSMWDSHTWAKKRSTHILKCTSHFCFDVFFSFRKHENKTSCTGIKVIRNDVKNRKRFTKAPIYIPVKNQKCVVWSDEGYLI